MREIINFCKVKLQFSEDINKSKTAFTLYFTAALSFLLHGFLVFYFLRLQLYIMLFINLGSCVVHGSNYMLNTYNKTRFVSIMTTVEIIVYSVLSTLILGPNIDSHWFILTVVVPQFILFDVNTRQRIYLITFAFLALNLSIHIHHFIPPMFPQDGNGILRSFHLNVVFVVIVLELTFNIFLDKIIQIANTSKIERYKELAHIDPLTKLKNRRFAQLYFQDMHYDDTSIYSFALLDIDHFKLINDTFGHDVGDKILITLSERLISSFRQGDLIARWGGEEFLIVMKDCDIEIAARLLENLRKNIENDTFELHESSAQLNFTVTIGAAVFDNHSVDDTILTCDNNLYKGKNRGRNCVVI